MTRVPHLRPDVDHYEAALQASCATLMTLQVIRECMAGACGGAGDVEAHIASAIEALQVAITELRLSHPERYGSRMVHGAVRNDVCDGAA
jgi:hypothetical protein